LHSTSPPFGLIQSKKVEVGTNGTTAVNFSILGSYYLVIYHRNGLQTWSANPVNITTSSVLYDFSSSATQAYGSNQKQVEPNVWAIYSGDLSADENIDLLDQGLLESAINSFASGYVASDINGDGNVDLLDVPTPEVNTNAFIYSIHP
jgi:hypothetical protein